MLKKTVILMAVLALALCVGCASSSASSASSSSSATSTSSAASAASNASAEQSTASSSSAQIPNPWSESEDAQRTAEGAGLESFVVPETIEFSFGVATVQQYRYMDGIAEADASVVKTDAEQADERLIVRKGTADEEGDVSGDYNTYARTWTQTVGELEASCFGNVEGAAAKVIWSAEDVYFSAVLTPYEGAEAQYFDSTDVETLLQSVS